MPGLSLECGDRAAHLARMTRYIHDGIERQTRKRIETIRNVSVDGDKAGAGRNRTGEPACGTRHAMTDSASMSSDRAPKKLAPA